MAEDSTTAADGPRERADRRFAEMLERTGLPDPRDRYRGWLRQLREQDEPAFRMALEYFEQRLVPAVASAESDPVREWTEYGLRLAQRLQPGSPVRIDGSGRSRSADASAPLDELVLHLPTSTREKALPVRIPPLPSAAQQATLQLLVRQGG